MYIHMYTHIYIYFRHVCICVSKAIIILHRSKKQEKGNYFCKYTHIHTYILATLKICVKCNRNIASIS